MRIVAYTYKAQLLCGACIIESMLARGEASPAAVNMDTEEALDQIAEANAIDRYDEHTFDSGDFPKVVFSLQLERNVTCHCCGLEL